MSGRFAALGGFLQYIERHEFDVEAAFAVTVCSVDRPWKWIHRFTTERFLYPRVIYLVGVAQNCQPIGIDSCSRITLS